MSSSAYAGEQLPLTSFLQRKSGSSAPTQTKKKKPLKELARPTVVKQTKLKLEAAPKKLRASSRTTNEGDVPARRDMRAVEVGKGKAKAKQSETFFGSGQSSRTGAKAEARKVLSAHSPSEPKPAHRRPLPTVLQPLSPPQSSPALARKRAHPHSDDEPEDQLSSPLSSAPPSPIERVHRTSPPKKVRGTHTGHQRTPSVDRDNNARQLPTPSTAARPRDVILRDALLPTSSSTATSFAPATVSPATHSPTRTPPSPTKQRGPGGSLRASHRLRSQRTSPDDQKDEKRPTSPVPVPSDDEDEDLSPPNRARDRADVVSQGVVPSSQADEQSFRIRPSKPYQPEVASPRKPVSRGVVPSSQVFEHSLHLPSSLRRPGLRSVSPDISPSKTDRSTVPSSQAEVEESLSHRLVDGYEPSPTPDVLFVPSSQTQLLILTPSRRRHDGPSITGTPAIMSSQVQYEREMMRTPTKPSAHTPQRSPSKTPASRLLASLSPSKRRGGRTPPSVRRSLESFESSLLRGLSPLFRSSSPIHGSSSSPHGSPRTRRQTQGGRPNLDPLTAFLDMFDDDEGPGDLFAGESHELDVAVTAELLRASAQAGASDASETEDEDELSLPVGRLPAPALGSSPARHRAADHARALSPSQAGEHGAAHSWPRTQTLGSSGAESAAPNTFEAIRGFVGMFDDDGDEDLDPDVDAS